MVDRELDKLRRQLAEGQANVKRAEAKANIEIEKSIIRRKLFLLKNPKKVALAKRFVRGLKVTGKKVGKGILKQGRLIQQQQERDRRLELAREKRDIKLQKGQQKILGRKGKRKKIKSIQVIKQPKTRQVFIPGLGVVSQQIGEKVVRKVTKKKAKRKTKRRKARRIRESQDTGFFGDLNF